MLVKAARAKSVSVPKHLMVPNRGWADCNSLGMAAVRAIMSSRSRGDCIITAELVDAAARLGRNTVGLVTAHSSSGTESGYKSRQMPVLERKSTDAADDEAEAPLLLLEDLLDDEAAGGTKNGRDATTVARKKKPSVCAKSNAMEATWRLVQSVGLCATRLTRRE